MRFPIKFPLFISVICYDDSFIFSGSIIIIIIQLCMFFTLIMPKDYYCPRCKSKNVVNFGSQIKCLECGKSFLIEAIESGIDKENILTVEDSNAILGAFDEDERKKIKEFLDDDFS